MFGIFSSSTYIIVEIEMFIFKTSFPPPFRTQMSCKVWLIMPEPVPPPWFSIIFIIFWICACGFPKYLVLIFRKYAFHTLQVRDRGCLPGTDISELVVRFVFVFFWWIFRAFQTYASHISYWGIWFRSLFVFVFVFAFVFLFFKRIPSICIRHQ